MHVDFQDDANVAAAAATATVAVHSHARCLHVSKDKKKTPRGSFIWLGYFLDRCVCVWVHTQEDVSYMFQKQKKNAQRQLYLVGVLIDACVCVSIMVTLVSGFIGTTTLDGLL